MPDKEERETAAEDVVVFVEREVLLSLWSPPQSSSLADGIEKELSGVGDDV